MDRRDPKAGWENDWAVWKKGPFSWRGVGEASCINRPEVGIDTPENGGAVRGFVGGEEDP